MLKSIENTLMRIMILLCRNHLKNLFRQLHDPMQIYTHQTKGTNR